MPFCKRKGSSNHTLRKSLSRQIACSILNSDKHWLQLNSEVHSMTDTELGVGRSSCTAPELVRNIPHLHRRGALISSL